MVKKVFLIIILGLSFIFGAFSAKDVQALMSCRCNIVLPAISPDPRSMCYRSLDFQDCSEQVSKVIAEDTTGEVRISDCIAYASIDCSGSPRADVASTVANQDGQTNGCDPAGGSSGREVCKLTNPIGSTEVSEIISTVIRVLLGIIGGLTLLMFVWGGFQWLTSAGSPEKIKSGMQTMIWAVIGVMLVLASYLLLSTFLDFLTGKAT